MPLRRLLGPASFAARSDRLPGTAATRSHILRSACFAATALLAPLLLLPATAFGESSNAASDKTQEAPLPRLDFQFDEPRLSLGFRGGWAFNRSKGDIYDFFTDGEELQGLSKSDFDAPAFIVDFSWRLISWLDVVFGVEYSGREQKSEAPRHTEVNGNPIVQKTRLTQVPLTLSLKIYPIGRGEQVGQYAWIRKAVVPYIGGGIGGTWYKLKLKGDFVDENDPKNEFIFSDVFTSDDWAFAQHVFAGVDIKLTRSFGLILEGRYYWADADVKGNFVDFNSIDLNGARAMIGFNWKL
jgi:opacity protein-like surface antigen